LNVEFINKFVIFGKNFLEEIKFIKIRRSQDDLSDISLNLV